MSSPSSRRTTRSSQAGTPRRSTRNSEAAQSSPAPGPAESASQEGSQAGRTPRAPRASQLQSSPLFFESSPAASRSRNAPGHGEVSSPLRHMTDSQSTAAPPMPSSPLRQQSDTQSIGDGDRTPRASGMMRGKHTPGISCESSSDDGQTPRRSDTSPAPARGGPSGFLTLMRAVTAVASSSPSPPDRLVRDVVISTQMVSALLPDQPAKSSSMSPVE